MTVYFANFRIRSVMFVRKVSGYTGKSFQNGNRFLLDFDYFYFRLVDNNGSTISVDKQFFFLYVKKRRRRGRYGERRMGGKKNLFYFKQRFVFCIIKFIFGICRVVPYTNIFQLTRASARAHTRTHTQTNTIPSKM